MPEILQNRFFLIPVEWNVLFVCYNFPGIIFFNMKCRTLNKIIVVTRIFFFIADNFINDRKKHITVIRRIGKAAFSVYDFL